MRPILLVTLVLLAGPVRAETHVGVTFARTEVDVTAEITGVLQDVRVRLGDAVEAGAILATLRDKPLRRALDGARAALAAARAEVDLREVEHQQAVAHVERRQGLNGAVSREQLADLESERAAAASRLGMAQAMVSQRAAEVGSLEDDLSRTQMRAPFDGTISVTQADAGSLLHPGTPVVRLLSTDLWLRFAVPPEQARSLVVGQSIHFHHDGDATPRLATIQQIAPDVDPIAGLVFVEADIAADTEADLVVGLVSRVRVGD